MCMLKSYPWLALFHENKFISALTDENLWCCTKSACSVSQLSISMSEVRYKPPDIETI